MIIAKNIAYGYSRQVVYADSSFSVIKGELIGLVGPNGVGRSTLFKLLRGEDHASSGSLQIQGKVGYVPQE